MGQSSERRLFVAVDDEGTVQVGGPWALTEIKGDAHRGNGTATTTPQSLAAANPTRKSLVIVNLSTDTVLWIGEDNTVTSDDGFPVWPQNTFIDDIANNEWFGIVATGTAAWRSLEV